MQTILAILTGIIALIGAAIPVWFKWKKYKNETSRNIEIAPDAADIQPIRDRLRKRFANSGKSDEKEI